MWGMIERVCSADHHCHLALRSLVLGKTSPIVLANGRAAGDIYGKSGDARRSVIKIRIPGLDPGSMPGPAPVNGWEGNRGDMPSFLTVRVARRPQASALANGRAAGDIYGKSGDARRSVIKIRIPGLDPGSMPEPVPVNGWEGE